MRRIARSRLESWLLLATLVGLFGCPLLLDDRFSTDSPRVPDAGDLCIGPACHVPYSNLGGSSGDAGTVGGSAGMAGTSAGSGGDSGSSGGSGGSGGAGGTLNVGGSAGSSGDDLACWTLELTDGSHDSSNSCLGIAGSNEIQKDTDTTLTLSYDGGDPCFTGTIAAAPDWGATFEFKFATGGGSWDADAAGVTGFEFAYRGSQQPQQVRVIYKDPSGTDNCRVINPGTTSVPFSAAHPSCSTSTSSPVVDSSQLVELILAILPLSDQSYAVDFCVQIRALD